jgi:putative transposase
MVRPAERRTVVDWARQAYRLSERRACRAVGVDRSSVRYRSVRPDQAPLRRGLKELASVRVRAGYRLLHVLLRREGWPVNHKRVYRLYSEEGLPLKRQRRRRHRSAVVRVERPAVTGVGQQWAMDFMHDTLANGSKIRVLTAIDLYTRECVALEAAAGFSGADVSTILARAASEGRSLPSRIRVDNGTEFTAKALDHWAYWNRVQLDFSRPGKPVDNAFVEAFNASLRRQCLSQHWFLSLEEAQATLDAWKEDYNNHRPHSSLGQLPPARYRAGGSSMPDPIRPETLASGGGGLG